MASWANEEEKKSLATLNTLKRVLGIANHPIKKDCFKKNYVHLFATDETSAMLLGELLYRYATGSREVHYNAHPELKTIRDWLSIEPLADGGYEVKMPIGKASNLTKMLDKLISKHIAPDQRFLR